MPKLFQEGPAAPSRYALIEAVRGFASILVVWSHTVNIGNNDFLHTYIFDPGKIGVVLFFFISGYLVIPSAARELSAIRFLVKRVARLYPLYWISIAGAFILWPNKLTTFEWLLNLSMAQQLFGVQNAINVYWTLTVEFCLYVLITTALVIRPNLLSNDTQKIQIALGMMCLIAAAMRMFLHMKIPVAIPLGLFCMFTGANLRVLQEKNKNLWITSLVYLIVVVPSCSMAYSFATLHNETSSRYILTYIIAFACFFMVVKRPDLDFGRVPRLLGDYSYGMYLFHALVIILLEHYINAGITLFLLVMFISIAISAPLYIYIERPFSEVGRALSKRIILQQH